MSFRFDDDDLSDMHEINMTPLVDVMLVLLVVFMVTLPVIKHAVNVNLPKANAVAKTKQELVRLSVTADGAYQWNDRKVDDAQLEQLLKTHANSGAEAVAIQLQGDAAVRYEKVAQVLAMAQREGVQKLSVVTQSTR